MKIVTIIEPKNTTENDLVNIPDPSLNKPLEKIKIEPLFPGDKAMYFEVDPKKMTVRKNFPEMYNCCKPYAIDKDTQKVTIVECQNNKDADYIELALHSLFEQYVVEFALATYANDFGLERDLESFVPSLVDSYMHDNVDKFKESAVALHLPKLNQKYNKPKKRARAIEIALESEPKPKDISERNAPLTPLRRVLRILYRNPKIMVDEFKNHHDYEQNLRESSNNHKLAYDLHSSNNHKLAYGLHKRNSSKLKENPQENPPANPQANSPANPQANSPVFRNFA